MTDERTQPTPDPASFMRGMTSRRMSRRNMLKYAGMGAGSLSLASILAACSKSSTTTGPGGQTSGAAMPNYDPSVAGTTVNFSNWPLYIDKARVNGETVYPSLEQFKTETGITVNYNDEINDNAQFFGELLPQLQAGADVGRDIIVITNGRELSALIRNGWVSELDASRRPNFDANAALWAQNPFYDDGNKYTMAWQSGLTGIGYNSDLVLAPITSMDDLMDPNKVPPASVGVLKADAPDLVMINFGIDPLTSTPDQWQEAANWLIKLRDSSTFRIAYDQGYVTDLTNKNLAATMAWSGDVLYYKIWEGYPFEFIVPGPGTETTGGALLWIDNMMIPANSANPAGSLEMMDFFYRPEIAQMVTEWVLYMSPVPAVQELIAQHAKDAVNPDVAAALKDTATSPMLWPDEQLLAQVSLGRQLDTDAEIQEWDSIFATIWEG